MYPTQNVGQVLEAPLITPPDIFVRNKVAAFRSALTNAFNAAFGIVNADVHEPDNKSQFLSFQHRSNRAVAWPESFRLQSSRDSRDTRVFGESAPFQRRLQLDEGWTDSFA